MKKSFFYSLIAILTFNSFTAKAIVNDPANLAQNILQVIQSRIESAITGNIQDIDNKQLDTETQTTADVVGMNSTVKTGLNLDLAAFNYENVPSALYKSYYQSLDVPNKSYNILLRLASIRNFYQANIVNIISPANHDLYVKRFNSLAEAIGQNDLMYNKFTNTLDNSGGNGTSLNYSAGNHSSIGQYSTGSTTQINTNTSGLQDAYVNQMNGINSQLQTIETQKNDVQNRLNNLPTDDPDYNNNFQSLTNTLNQLNGQSNAIKSQVGSITSSFQSQIEGTLGNVANSLGLGGVFGTNASEKGKGENIQVTAPMGRMSDAQRIDFANTAFKNVQSIDTQVSILERELQAIKASYSIKKYVADNKFSSSDFYDKSKSMDYTQMMNFDK